jgi:hypothetical protein
MPGAQPIPLSKARADLLYQALSAVLAAYAGINPSANVQALLASADFAAMKTLLGLIVGTDVQAHSAALDAVSGTNTGDQTTVSGNAGTATILATARTIGGVSFNGSANITVSTATGGFTVSGGDLAIGANNLTMTGSLGATGARLTKGWFTDLQCTNAMTGSITGNAATVTTNANLTGDVTSSGNTTTLVSIPAISGANLTSIPAASLTGTIADARLPASVAQITTMSALTTIGASGITTTFPGLITLTKGTDSSSTSAGTLVLSGSGGLAVGGKIFAGGYLVISGGLYFGNTGGQRTYFQAVNVSGGGVATLYDDAGADFKRLQLGGTTASFPAIKRNATAINIRLADDSADAPLTASNITASGTLAVTGAITPTGGIIGVITVSNATAGNVGQTIQTLVASLANGGSPVSLTTNTPANVASISLTAGDWWVQGNVNFTETVATASARSAGISATSATLPTDGTEAACGVQSTLTTEVNTITPAWKRVNVSSTTTVYLVASAAFSAGTVAAYGSITALRASR